MQKNILENNEVLNCYNKINQLGKMLLEILIMKWLIYIMR